jgi:hypothetical protein
MGLDSPIYREYRGRIDAIARQNDRLSGREVIVNTQATRRGVPAVALWGGLGALAWAALTVLTGGGSAHADEQHDSPLLDGVTSLVSNTVSTVGDTVTAVTAPLTPVVTQVVAPVVTQVVAPVQQAAPVVVETGTSTVAEVPVVGPATAPVVAAVTDTAQAVVEPVTDLLQDAPVSQIVQPIQDAVATLPIVGSLLQDLGVITLLDNVVGIVDDTTSLVGGVVDQTVPPVLEALDPTTPAVTPIDLVPDASTSAPALTADSAVSDVSEPAIPATTSSVVRAFPLAQATSALDEPATTSPASEDPASPFSGLPGAPAAPSSSAASGGGSAVSHARLSDVNLTPLRAWERTSGASDDVLPTSLIADTDVSPD